MSGLTVNQILAAANQALAGLGLPPGHDFSSLGNLVGNLNVAYHDYVVSAWAQADLSTPMIVAQCASQVPALSSIQVNASDNCGGPVTVVNLPDVISDQTCPNRFKLTRSWMARDACGNASTCSYVIMVDDTTPPVLTCPQDKIVAAGQAWNFDQPLTTDNCGSVTLHVLSTTTNATGPNTFVASREQRL